MKAVPVLWLSVACLLWTGSSPAATPQYSQTYTVLIKGVPCGTETVTEEWGKDGNLVSSSQSEIFITDGLDTKRLAFVTQMVMSKSNLAPISYSYRYTSGESKDGYEVTVKDGRIRRVLNRGGNLSEVTIPLLGDVTILDFNVYHQYDYLIRKYDAKKGGRQSFHNFVPLIGNEMSLAITRLEDTNLENAKGTLPVRNFKIEFVGIWTGTMSADKSGRLVRLVLRAQDLEVVRKDLLPEPEQPKAEPEKDPASVSPPKLPDPPELDQ